MTELQIGLIGLGVVAVFGVVVYNTWLEYRHRKLAQQLLQPSQDDVLLGRGADAESESAPEFDAATRVAPDDDGFDAPADEAGDEEAAFDERAAPPAVEPAPATGGAWGLASRGVFAAARSEPVLRQSPEREERIEPVLASFEDDDGSERASPPPMPAPATVAPAVVPVAVIPVAQTAASLAAQPMRAPEPVAENREPPAPVVPPRPREEAAPAPATPVAPAAEDVREVVEPLHLMSPAIDYIAAFEAIEPASARQILSAQRDALARVGKPVLWLGFDETAREWEVVDADGEAEYRSLRVGLQLVDRRGPIGESDLSVFHVAMQDLSHVLMAIVDMPHRQAALEAATALDRFCAEVDIQIGINVISTGTLFQGTKIRALAEAAGMVIDAAGRFVRADDDGNILYVLLNQESAGFSSETMKSMSTHGLTFLLDVPTVAHGDRVFNQMVDLAKRFADVLKGALVDDNRRPLPDGALEPIRRQIVQFQSTMAARRLPAGGTLAKRLFS